MPRFSSISLSLEEYEEEDAPLEENFLDDLSFEWDFSFFGIVPMR